MGSGLEVEAWAMGRAGGRAEGQAKRLDLEVGGRVGGRAEVSSEATDGGRGVDMNLKGI